MSRLRLSHCVAVADTSTGWASGNLGTILGTSDGGATWSSQSSGFIGLLFDVRFTDGANGWAVGTSGTILNTTNGGSTWSSQTSGTTRNLEAIAVVVPEPSTTLLLASGLAALAVGRRRTTR